MSRFHVPPSCQGQIVEVAYALCGDGDILLRRTTDGSTGTMSYDMVRLYDDDDVPADMWQREPVIDAERWRSITEDRAEQLAAR